MSQPPDDHLKALWQGQETETPTMTVMAIRTLARNYGDAIRGRIWMGMALAVFEALYFGGQAWRAPNDTLRVGYLLILAGLGWMTWRVVSRWPARLPQTQASVAALIEFHRAQLERSRSSAGQLFVTVAPMFAGVAVATVGLHRVRPNMSWLNAAPVALLGIAWWIAAFILQRRQARRLAAQIAEMDSLRRD